VFLSTARKSVFDYFCLSVNDFWTQKLKIVKKLFPVSFRVIKDFAVQNFTQNFQG